MSTDRIIPVQEGDFGDWQRDGPDSPQTTGSGSSSPFAAKFASANPVEFSLYNTEDERALYITDAEAQLQTLILEVTNKAPRAIALETPDTKAGLSWITWKASKEVYHFQLQFRPGTLSEKSKTLLRQGGLRNLALQEGWDLCYDPDMTDPFDWISLLWMGPNGHSSTLREPTAPGAPPSPPGPFLKPQAATLPLLDANAVLKFHLPQLSAGAGGGARGTRVHLAYRHLVFQSGDSRDVPEGSRNQYLNIVNHQGKDHLPLHAGFVGSNAIVNDGVTPNELTLRLTNISQKEAIPFTAPAIEWVEQEGSNLVFPKDQLQTTSEVSIKQGTITFEMRFLSEEIKPGTNPFLLSGKTFEHFEVHLTPNCGIRFILHTNTYLDTEDKVFELKKWVHLACVYNADSKVAILFIDGKQVRRKSVSEKLTSGAISFALGYRWSEESRDAYAFHGKISSVRIWDKERTKAEIASHVADVLDPFQDHLLYCWPPVARRDQDKTPSRPPSPLTISFEVQNDGEEAKPGALGTRSQLQELTVSPKDSTTWRSQAGTNGLHTVHVIRSRSETKLNPHQHIDFQLGNIFSSLPFGSAKLIVSYEDLPGYWDGAITCLIERTPIVVKGNGGTYSDAGRNDSAKSLPYRAERVGIGTDDPEAKLHVSAKNDNASTVSKKPVAIFEGGRVGIGVSDPDAELHVGKPAEGHAAKFEGMVTVESLEGSGHVSVPRFLSNGVHVGPILGEVRAYAGELSHFDSQGRGKAGTELYGWALCDANYHNGAVDLSGRFVLGTGGGTGLTSRAMKVSGGAETHKLTELNLPVHTHGVSAEITGGGHTHLYRSGHGSDWGIHNGDHGAGEIGRQSRDQPTEDKGEHSHQLNCRTDGGKGESGEIDHMPPFYVLAYIQFIGVPYK